MAKKEYVIDDDFRLKAVNLLKGYGYYKGALVKSEVQRAYVNGQLKLTDIIKNKNDFKELKASVNAALEYCYANNFDEIESVIKYFYKTECMEVRKLYGNFFDKH